VANIHEFYFLPTAFLKKQLLLLKQNIVALTSIILIRQIVANAT